MSLNNAVQMQCKCGANSPSERSFRLLLSAIGKYGAAKYGWQKLISSISLNLCKSVLIRVWKKFQSTPESLNKQFRYFNPVVL